MPKARDDLQVVAYKIDEAIAQYQVSALPLFPPPRENMGLGRWPSVVLLREPLRRRFPQLHVNSREKYETRTGNEWDNRMTIPACVLNGRFVSVSEKSPDYADLLRASRQERRAVQVIETSRGLRRRIYEVVEDFSHALRQIAHIRNLYQSERERWLREKLQIEDRMRQESSGLIHFRGEEQRLLFIVRAQLEMRLGEIDRITEDRTLREQHLQVFVRMSNVHLFFLSQSLFRFVQTLQRQTRWNYPAIGRYLEGLISELSLFTSRELRSYCVWAREAIKKVIQGGQALPREDVYRLLNVAAAHLQGAGVELSKWADSLTEGERMRNFLLPTYEPETATL